MTEEVIDLFAGPGGWDVAARRLGLDPLGIEWDTAACAIRAAAGLRTRQADVSALDPCEYAGTVGLIASPPCTAFSMAGAGEGRKALALFEQAIGVMAAGQRVDRWQLDDRCGDRSAHLVLEPLRWALALEPRWIACEQVEPVLPVWEAMGFALRARGYSAWWGVISAEQHGVPQTRRRAILIASRDRQVERPRATHQRYIAPRRRDVQEDSLFAPPEPERIVAPEDRDLLPWVSMAEALGWGMNARPCTTLVAGQKANGGGVDPLSGGSGSRARLRDERDAGRWEPSDRVGFPRLADSDHAVELDGEAYRERDLRAASEPAFALTEKARSWVRLRCTNDRTKASERALDQPAQTLAFGHNAPSWVVVDTGNTRSGTRECGRERSVDEPSVPLTTRADQMEVRYNSRGQRDGRTGELNRQRRVGEPAPTISGESRNDSWMVSRPATTVAGENAVRVTIAEAAVLQSFPADYPFMAAGTKTKAFEGVGNAVPVLLADAVLRAVLPEARTV